MKFNINRMRSLLIVSVIVLSVMAIGCASNDEKKEKHLERANDYIENSEFKKAVIELKNVIQLDPKNDSAHYKLGETHLKLKQGSEAFQSFSRAASINAENLEKCAVEYQRLKFMGRAALVWLGMGCARVGVEN